LLGRQQSVHQEDQIQFLRASNLVIPNIRTGQGEQIFGLLLGHFAKQIKEHEDVREDSVFDSGGGDLHKRVCGRTHAAKLQEERQELPDERQQGL